VGDKAGEGGLEGQGSVGWQWKERGQHEGVQGATADGILHKGRKRLIALYS
jgi:hypothetical protein